MPSRIETLDKVPESKLIATIKGFSDDEADIVTAVNNRKGSFTVEATFTDSPSGPSGATIILDGKMSTFGGPNDTGVRPDEGLSLFDTSDIAANPDLFLPAQPPGTTGLARRLNPQANYVACRWNLGVTPKSFLKTIKVKVTNPANKKSAEARPADTGPAIATGRVADLSPGLAKALGLKTDKTCQVTIPLPADAQALPAGTGVAVGVNPKKIDSTIFPSDMARKLVVMTTSDQTTYWVVNQIGPNEGGQSLLRHADGITNILRSDTTVFPVKASDQIPAAVADELNKAAPDVVASFVEPGSPPQPGDDINAREFASAKAFVGHDTSHVPGTDGGNLACAWSVNEVTRRALGKPISTDGQGGNGLGTAGIFAELKAHHTRLNSAADAKPGTIIIAPTEGANHGHVGVVGGTTGSVTDTAVFSNSSSDAKFEQNYTIGKFTSRYVGKGLQVLFFALNRDQF
jgi:hypothetical protein